MGKEDKERVVLRIALLSDLHITSYRNLLEPMIDSINSDKFDLVVVNGDLVHERNKNLFDIATKCLNRINHRVVVVPGDYDNGELWVEAFGQPYKSINLNGYSIDFLDTSFMRHRFAVGWGDVIEDEHPEQFKWFKERLKVDNYHLVFSHHPLCVTPSEEVSKVIGDNVRGIYSGHLRETISVTFKYEKPRMSFEEGFSVVPLKFHGNACYLAILIGEDGGVVNVPRVIRSKKTAW